MGSEFDVVLHRNYEEILTLSQHEFQNSIIICDDCQEEDLKNKHVLAKILELININCHHDKCTLFITAQLISPDSLAKKIIKIASYIIIFNGRQTSSLLVYLQKQLYPYLRGILSQAARRAFIEFNYLVIDFTVEEKYSLKTGILPDQMIHIFKICNF